MVLNDWRSLILTATLDFRLFGGLEDVPHEIAKHEAIQMTMFTFDSPSQHVLLHVPARP
ncbi:hypothetical protein POX_b02455 [Penicillium oxalicum]|uniref:hypothetical protein n=1 Tax=Penicillium oxalicum TaxID=69781 RepID=UPI0020B676EB|nr:hypothetical protein POX_b02455 [Penicillium oxalicum]KAI2792417.1 hypothetical protein POX_b02455 [Penicillium oxalicum]